VSFRYPSACDGVAASLEGEGASLVPHDARTAIAVLPVTFAAARARGTWWPSSAPPGAGKSTLAALVPRLYDVTDGRAAHRRPRRPARSPRPSLRAAVGVVSQDPHLFHDTVGNNLRYARPDATQQEIEAACRAAQVHHVIAGLPDGYDTMVGERGTGSRAARSSGSPSPGCS
jgi:ATP-binding cassette subfamily B protein